MIQFLLGNAFMLALWLWVKAASIPVGQLASQHIDKVARMYSKTEIWDETLAISFAKVSAIVKEID
ncbi:MAG: hypothetical protein WAN66_05030 [Limnoraphis robusta]|uniref:Uncharacterized protein n=1 Tax=Limnoraphis robusta CS-951 TaxID=1637645 RepID=A0A0F5Y7T0_9CYAN|nr:hypothetical protein [Limnoraphis robusta]KKD34808.1 hypothetical protein WN50_28840 [Limnoraphis robusta CS-951]